jgi:hypothetical protein
MADLEDLSRPELERALLAIDLFPRCAFLLTFFEGLSVMNTSVLLDADRELVKAGQVRGAIELTRNLRWGHGWVPNLDSHEAPPSKIVAKSRNLEIVSDGM